VTLLELTQMGFQVRAEGDVLKIRPKEKLTPELIVRIKAAKPQLILEIRIRQMAAWWRYSAAETDLTVELAAADPKPWMDLVADDEAWRAVHPEHRPTVPEAGHAG
jgi:hypothetical protein